MVLGAPFSVKSRPVTKEYLENRTRKYNYRLTLYYAFAIVKLVELLSSLSRGKFEEIWTEFLESNVVKHSSGGFSRELPDLQRLDWSNAVKIGSLLFEFLMFESNGKRLLNKHGITKKYDKFLNPLEYLLSYYMLRVDKSPIPTIAGKAQRKKKKQTKRRKRRSKGKRTKKCKCKDCKCNPCKCGRN